MTVVVGEDRPASVLVPIGIVHAYQNVGVVEGIVINRLETALHGGRQSRKGR